MWLLTLECVGALEVAELEVGVELTGWVLLVAAAAATVVADDAPAVEFVREVRAAAAGWCRACEAGRGGCATA